MIVLVPERARQCVLFVGIKTDGAFLPRATAFAVEIEEHQYRWIYLVAAEHVISGLLTRGMTSGFESIPRVDLLLRSNVIRPIGGFTRTVKALQPMSPSPRLVSMEIRT
jgi:hypothetical protein